MRLIPDARPRFPNAAERIRSGAERAIQRAAARGAEVPQAARHGAAEAAADVAAQYLRFGSDARRQACGDRSARQKVTIFHGLAPVIPRPIRGSQ
jgi:hypothetical protein